MLPDNIEAGCTCGPWMSILPPPPCRYHSAVLASLPCGLCGHPFVGGRSHVNCADSMTNTTVGSLKWAGPPALPYVPKHRKEGVAQ